MIWLAAGVASAQTGGGYDLAWSVIGDGGQTSSAADYELDALGQPDAGTMSGGTYALSSGFLAALGPSAEPPACVGDCDSSIAVDVTEIITMANIALGTSPLADCMRGDASGDGQITVDEILQAVNRALTSCPVS